MYPKNIPDRTNIQYLIASLAFLKCVIELIWVLSVGKYALRTEGFPKRPLSWAWVDTMREAVLALFFGWVALYWAFGIFNRKIHVLALSVISVSALFTFVKWVQLDRPDKRTVLLAPNPRKTDHDLYNQPPDDGSREQRSNPRTRESVRAFEERLPTQ